MRTNTHTQLQFDVRAFHLKNVGFAGIGGVHLTSRSVSNDNPQWMVRHRIENNPESVVSRHVKTHAFHTRPAGVGKPTDFIKSQTALLESGDAPEWMVARNKRIHRDLVVEPPLAGAGRRQWHNRHAPKSYHSFPEPHTSEIQMQSHTTRFERALAGGKRGGYLVRAKDLEYKPAGVRRNVYLDGRDSMPFLA